MSEYKVSESFHHKYKAAIQLHEKAKKRLAEGAANDILTAARKSLEFFVKDGQPKIHPPAGLQAVFFRLKTHAAPRLNIPADTTNETDHPQQQS